MATTRLLRTTRPLGLGLPSSTSSSSSSSFSVRCLNKAGFDGDKRVSENCRRKPMVAVKATVAFPKSLITAQPQVNRGLLDLASLVANISKATMILLRIAVKRRPRKFHLQMFIERAIIDCRFFTLFAVAGNLLGSGLCFLEGCFTILEAYLQYFHTLTLSHKSDQGHVMQLLIEAIDMFLVGTTMLIFGMGLYVMFVGTKTMKEKGSGLSGSNFFGLFYLKSIPTWIGMQSVSQAKSKIGHAVMMILQVGVLDKLKSVPVVTGLDLACFAGAVFISSACIFFLSKLSVGSTMEEEDR
ncbi:hypothetical protein ACB098_01G039000 [Castanea mollissima]